LKIYWSWWRARERPPVDGRDIDDALAALIHNRPPPEASIEGPPKGAEQLVRRTLGRLRFIED
jgi:hypothetical protein